jgi:hypothetical protein
MKKTMIRLLTAIIIFSNLFTPVWDNKASASVNRVSLLSTVFHDVAYSPALKRFVAVGNDGDTGQIYTSDDAKRWTNRPISASYKLQPHNQSIIWNPVIEKFVVLREDDRSRLLISADGISWSETASGESHLRSIYWDGSRYIVSKNNGGAAYTLLTSTSTAFPLTFMTAGSVSPTGAYMGNNAIPSMISKDGSSVLFVSRNNKGSLSTNWGVTWSGAFNAYARDVVYSQTLDRYITAYANTFFPDRKYAIINPNDAHTEIGAAGNIDHYSYAISIGNGKIIIGTSSGKLYRAEELGLSANSQFTEIMGSNAKAIHGIAYGNGNFVAVGEGGILAFGSSDTEYVQASTLGSTVFHDVVYSPGLNTFVAVGNDGESLHRKMGSIGRTGRSALAISCSLITSPLYGIPS